MPLMKAVGTCGYMANRFVETAQNAASDARAASTLKEVARAVQIAYNASLGARVVAEDIAMVIKHLGGHSRIEFIDFMKMLDVSSAAKKAVEETIDCANDAYDSLKKIDTQHIIYKPKSKPKSGCCVFISLAIFAVYLCL
jgi:predicted GTPase